MEQDRKARNKPMHLWSINLWQNKQDYRMLERESLQQMVLGTLDIQMGKKMKLNHSLTSNTKKLKMDWRPKCETRHYNALIGKQAKHSLT